MKSVFSNRREAGWLLGPLFHDFCCRLYWQTANYDCGTDALLFMSRGGLRLQYLFERFLQIQQLDFNIPLFPFWISRFAGVKLTFQENPELAVSNLVHEFGYTNCATMARALLPECLFPDKAKLIAAIPAAVALAPVTRENFFRLYYHECSYSCALRQHFSEQHDTGHAWLKQQFGAFRTLHTVDSGWYGSTLGTLQTGCKEWRWDALYFGRWNYRNAQPWYFNDIIGLVIDAIGLDGMNPEDVFLEYHHLLESVLEPDIPSVEVFFPNGACNAMTEDWKEKVAGCEQDDLWTGVLDYFTSRPSITVSAVARKTAETARIWRHLLRYPSAEEARILEVPPRSADFGKDQLVPIFQEPERTSHYTYWRSIKRSLWPAGQLAVSSTRFRWQKQLVWHILKKIARYRGAV